MHHAPQILGFRRRSAQLSRLVLTLSFIGALLTALAPGADAHSELESSNPAEAARLDRAPAKVTLMFNQQIAAEFASVSLTIDKGQPQQLDPAVKGPRVAAAVPEAAALSDSAGDPVQWRVGYRVVSADGHPITGQIQFLAPTPATETKETAAPPPSSPSAAEQPQAGSSAGVEDTAIEPATSDSENSAVLSTLVIGGLTAAAALGAMAWLVRGRKRASDQ